MSRKRRYSVWVYMTGDTLSIWNSCFCRLESANKRARELAQRPSGLITYKAAVVFDEQDRKYVSRFLRDGYPPPIMIAETIARTSRKDGDRHLPRWIVPPVEAKA